MTKEKELFYEEPAGFDHIAAEGMDEIAKDDYARRLVEMPQEEMFKIRNSISGAGYFQPRDQIFLSDESFHEHELIHRLANRVNGDGKKYSEPPENSEKIVNEDLAETYGLSVDDTEAYILEDYHETVTEVMKNFMSDTMSVEIEDRDVYAEIDVEEPENHGQLDELVAHYLTEDVTRNSVEMMFGYGIMPWNFREASRALERLDKDSNFDRGVMARRALGHDNVYEMIETGKELPEVGLMERSELNGELWDEGHTRLLFRSLKDII